MSDQTLQPNLFPGKARRRMVRNRSFYPGYPVDESRRELIGRNPYKNFLRDFEHHNSGLSVQEILHSGPAAWAQLTPYERCLYVKEARMAPNIFRPKCNVGIKNAKRRLASRTMQAKRKLNRTLRKIPVRKAIPKKSRTAKCVKKVNKGKNGKKVKKGRIGKKTAAKKGPGRGCVMRRKAMPGAKNLRKRQLKRIAKGKRRVAGRRAKSNCKGCLASVKTSSVKVTTECPRPAKTASARSVSKGRSTPAVPSVPATPAAPVAPATPVVPAAPSATSTVSAPQPPPSKPSVPAPPSATNPPCPPGQVPVSVTAPKKKSTAATARKRCAAAAKGAKRRRNAALRAKKRLSCVPADPEKELSFLPRILKSFLSHFKRPRRKCLTGAKNIRKRQALRKQRLKKRCRKVVRPKKKVVKRAAKKVKKTVKKKTAKTVTNRRRPKVYERVCQKYKAETRRIALKKKAAAKKGRPNRKC